MEHHPEPTFVELIRYNNWANAQVIDACRKLTQQQLAFPVPGVYGAIYPTLVHIVRAEADYIHRLTGQGPQPSFRWADEPSLDAIAAYSQVVADALLHTVQRVPPDHMVHEEEDGNTMDYKASMLFIQVISHGMEHRTNITTILSALDLPMLEVDGWGYLFAYPETFALKETFKEEPDAEN